MHTTLSVLRPWYVVLTGLAVLFVAERATGVAANAFGARALRIGVAILAAVLLVRVIRIPIVYGEDYRTAKTFLPELRAGVPPHETIYTWDNPGFLGFFSGRRVVDGDGLVNDHAYARRLRAGALAGYLEEENICYVVVSVADDDPVLEVAGLSLRRADVEQLYVMRRKQSSQPDYELHRLASERCARR
jgi:hypothetical protein